MLNTERITFSGALDLLSLSMKLIQSDIKNSKKKILFLSFLEYQS